MMRSGTRKEDAVSPVIATILLLIMTVTVITVAALVVTDIAGGYGDAKSVDIRVSPTGTDALRVVVTGGPDAVSLRSLTLSAEKMAFEDGGVVADPQVGLPDVIEYGSSVAGEVLLTLVGTFADGTVQMVYQGTVNVQAGGSVPTPHPSVMPTATVTTATPTPTATPQTSVNNSVTAYFRSYVNTTENLPAGQTYVIPGRGIYLHITKVTEGKTIGSVMVSIDGGWKIGIPGTTRQAESMDITSPAAGKDYYFYLNVSDPSEKANPYEWIRLNPAATVNITATFTFNDKTTDKISQNVEIGERQVIFTYANVASGTVNVTDLIQNGTKWQANITAFTSVLDLKKDFVEIHSDYHNLTTNTWTSLATKADYPSTTRLTVWDTSKIEKSSPSPDDLVEIFLYHKVGKSDTAIAWYRIQNISGNEISMPA